MAIEVYSSMPLSESAPKPAATSSESIATGATLSCLEVPRSA